MDVQKWKRKKEKAQIDGNIDSVYFACKELANIYFNDEKYDLALREYKEMERISETCGHKMDIGRANRMIGEIYCEKGEFEKAITHQRKHLVISREEKDKVEEQRALATLGRTYFLQGESIIDLNSGTREMALAEAKKFYMDSLAISYQLADGDVGNKQRMEMIARLFLNIGLVLDCQYQYESAIDHMQKAVSICKRLDLWEDLYRTYSALGSSYHKHKDKNQAIKAYDLALNVAERLSNKSQMMCDVLLLKFDVLLDLPDLRGARQALLKAYKLKAPNHSTQEEVERKLRTVALMCECEEKLTELSSESDETERKKLYEEMGDAAAELSNFKMALTYYHLMLECIEKSGSERKALIDAYISLAQTYKDDQQLVKSLEYFEKELALEEENSSEACKTLLNIAEVHQLMGRRKDMFATYHKAKSISVNLTDTKVKKAVLSAFYTALVEDNQSVQAEELKRELNSLYDYPGDSSDEDEDPPRNYGSHICLDDLTDEESVPAKEENTKATRTRTVRRKGNLERRNDKGETPLHVACINGNTNLVLKLIKQGHRVDVKDYSGWTPLHEACNHGHNEVVKVLLENGAPVNDRGGPHCDGVTPLLDAASNGNLDIIELLLNYGASPLMRTNGGETVIDCLSGWRRRRYEELGVDFEGSLSAQYSNTYKKLAKILENAGQKLHSSPVIIERDPQIKVRAKKIHDSPQRISNLPKNVLESSNNAASQYESTMKALRYRYNKLEKNSGLTEPSKPVRALLTDNETVGDDWLEDDLEENRPNKKRRTGGLNSDLIGRRFRECGIQGPSPRTSTHISSSSDSSEEETSEIGKTSPLQQDLIDENIIQVDTSPSSDQQIQRPADNSLKRKQIQFTSSGFTKKKSSEMNREDVREEPPATNSITHQSYSCVKVRIEGKVVIVPVTSAGEGRTISWLAEEAAKRYKSLEGVEPVLQLEMEGGGLLFGSDPLSIVTHSPLSILEARVLSWKVTALTTLYEEACTSLNTKSDVSIKYAIEGCQATGSVSVADMYLKWTTIVPVLRAVSHYQSLQKLSLASTNVSDSNILEVAECIVKLPQLRSLDLSNINISDVGLEMFSQNIKTNNGLKKLEHLKLGYNPLGDCLHSLAILLDCASSVRNLSIPDIGLTSRSFSSFTHFSLGGIEKLDLNYNEIGREAIVEILGLLESRILVELKLAGSGKGVLREIGFFLEHQAPPNLRVLDLSYCSHSKEDFEQLVRGASMCRVLEKISLDGEGDIGGNTVDLLGLTLQELSLCGLNSDLAPEFGSAPSNVSTLLKTSSVSQPTNALRGPYGLTILRKE